jgi:hypothetical protein
MEQARLAQAIFEGCGVRGSTAVSGADAFDVVTLSSLLNILGRESIVDT